MSSARWVTEQDVVDLLDLPAAIEAIEGAFRSEADDRVASMAKTHLLWGEGDSLHAIGAVDEVHDVVATKTWAHTSGGATPLLLVWSASSGQLLAIIEAFALGQLRTGAVSGVATRHLASAEATQMALIGSGKQALAQVAAVASVRPIERVRVYSPSAAHRFACIDRIVAAGFGFDVEAAASVADAVDGAEIVTTVTRAREAFLEAQMLIDVVHVNAVGAITPERRELGASVLARADLVAADSPPVARRLAAELERSTSIERLCDVVAGSLQVDPESAFTVFKAMGVGLADLALGVRVLERARSTGRGRRVSRPERAVPMFKER